MSIIHYDVSINPSAPQMQLGISATASDLTVKINSIGSFSLDVSPAAGTIAAGAVSGAVAGLFAGGPLGALLGGGGGVGAVYAAGAAIKSALEDQIKSNVPGQSETISFGQPLGLSVKVAGVEVHAALSNVQLASYNGMLMATGQLQIS